MSQIAIFFFACLFSLGVCGPTETPTPVYDSGNKTNNGQSGISIPKGKQGQGWKKRGNQVGERSLMRDVMTYASNRRICTRTQNEDRIIHGDIAYDGWFPFAVSILRQGDDDLW